MLQALPEITRVALGSTQSANSISDRDVLLQIIRPFFGGMIEEDNKTGKFYVNLVSEERVRGKINGAMKTLLSSQTKALQEADSIFNSLSTIRNVESTGQTGLQFIQTHLPRRAAFDLSASQKGQMPVFDIIDIGGKKGLQLQGQS